MMDQPSSNLSKVQHQLKALGDLLKADGYTFFAPTPLTQARVLARQRPGPDLLQDTFGWNKPVLAAVLPERYRKFLVDQELFAADTDGQYRARIRFSSLGPLLLAHSGYPTYEADAVFFGPDTYRFVHALRAFSEREPKFTPRKCVDIGTGTGAGGLFCARQFPSLMEVGLLDINARAIAFSAANVALNGAKIASARHSDILSGWEGPADLIVANPPYLVDPAQRAYRHGGGDWGASLSVRILEQALTHLSPEGHLLIYTGSAVVNGEDKFLDMATTALAKGTLRYRYEVIDPDVFGEELDKWPYDQADRIATVMLHVKGSDLKRWTDAPKYPPLQDSA